MMDQTMKPIYVVAAVLFCTLPASAADEQADSKVIMAPPNLVADGIPPISRELADSVGRYTEFRAAFLADWHPTERQMLIATRFANTAQVHRVKFPGGARTQLTFFPEPVGAASFPRKTADYFVLSKDIGGNEFDQNFRYDLADGTLTLLTDGKSRNSAGTWSRGGDQLAYTSTRRNGKDTDLYIVNPTDPKTDKLLVQLEGGGWSPLDWSPEDAKILLGEYVSVNESYLWLVDVKTGDKALITPRAGEGAEKIAYSGGKFSADGKSFYVATDKGSEFARLALVNMDT
jgi:hypothetical protein